MRFRYTEEHLAFLRDGYRVMNIPDLTKAFNARFKTKKSEKTIKSALQNYKIRCGRKGNERLIRRKKTYTDEMILFLEVGYKSMNLKELTKAFNKRFGTEKAESAIHAALGNRGITSGRTGYFEKNHTPWNAGTKGQGLTGPNSGSFKKGSVPANRRPMGSERVCSKDGYILIKVDETNPHTGFRGRYRHKHIVIWEAENGTVPAGHAVVFKDGNKRNCDIDNLILVKRSELLRMNKRQYKKMPAELKPSVLALAKLEVGIFEKSKEADNG